MEILVEQVFQISGIFVVSNKLTKMSQDLKSKLCPNINDSLSHCPAASTAWL